MPDPSLTEGCGDALTEFMDTLAKERQLARWCSAKKALYPGPGHLYRVELGAIGRQIHGGSSTLGEGFGDAGHPMDARPVHDDEITGLKVWPEVLSEERDELVAIDVPFHATKGSDAVEGDGADQADALSVNRSLDPGRLSRRCPPVRPAHGDVDARLIEKHQFSGFQSLLPADKGATRLYDVRPAGRLWTKAPFFRVYPKRRTVYDMVWGEIFTPRDSLNTSQISRSVVSGTQSKMSRIMASPASSTRRARRAPPIGDGSTDPVVRTRPTHRTTVCSPIANRSAISFCVLPPSCQTSMTLVRISRGYGRGIVPPMLHLHPVTLTRQVNLHARGCIA